MEAPSSKPANTEVHLFILWENARPLEEKILADISEKFRILKAYEVHWSQEKFSDNLSRFYGTKLPANSRKELHVGTQAFLAVIIEDRQPIYKIHTTTKGDMEVNSKLFTSKTLHRDWTGGGHKIHATNTPDEADHDLMLLFGKTSGEFLSEAKDQDGYKIEKWQSDLVGANGWDSLTELFKVLSATTKYVVLRNYELMPDQFYFGRHGDIDLLVENYKDAQLIINCQPVFSQNYRVHNEVKIGQENVRLDLRFVGDNYYDQRWQKTILTSRQFHKNAFYIADQINYFYSLLYHALIQKTEVSPDYIERLCRIAKETDVKLDEKSFSNGQAAQVLADFLKKTNYSYTQPYDKSVYFNRSNASFGIEQGVKFVKSGMTPFRNYLKSAKVPVKHYAAKAKRIVSRKFGKIFGK